MPEDIRAAFGMKLFRKSLRTKIQSEALARAAVVEREYEARVARALGAASIAVPTQSLPITAARISRPVTNADLDFIEARQRRHPVAWLEPHVLRADVDPAHREFLEAKVNELEMSASARRRAIEEWGFVDPSGILPSPLEEARLTVKEFGFDAPEGSEEFGTIVSAIRRGYRDGEYDLHEMLAGRLKPVVRTAHTEVHVGDESPTLTDTVGAYIAFKRFGRKTTSEIRLTLRLFTELHGENGFTISRRTISRLSRATLPARLWVENPRAAFCGLLQLRRSQSG